MPCHTKTVTRRPSPPWYNDTLHEAKCRRRQAKCTWRSTDLEVHCQIHRHEMTVKVQSESFGRLSSVVFPGGNKQEVSYGVKEGLFNSLASSQVHKVSQISSQLIQDSIRLFIFIFIYFIYCHLYSAFSIVQCSNALYRL